MTAAGTDGASRIQPGDLPAPDPSVPARIARFARTYDPRALWPALAPDVLAMAQRRLEDVARSVLGDGVPALRSAGAADAHALRIGAFVTGTGALLGRWIDDGRVDASDDLRATFLTELARARARAALIEQGASRVLDALLGAGVVPVLHKGVHTAFAYWEEPALRPVADVDVLVPAARIDDVERALAGAGFVPTQPAGDGRRPYKRHWRGSDVSAVHPGIEGVDPRAPWEVDVHVSFDRAFHGGIATLDALGSHVAPFSLDGRRVLAPAQPLLLALLACQLSESLRSLRLLRVIELVRVIRADAGRGALDWAGVRDAVAAAGVERYVWPALALADRLAPGVVDARMLASGRRASSLLARRVVPRLRPAGAPPGRISVAMLLMWARGPLGVLRTLAVIVRRHAARGPRHVLTTALRLVRRGDGGTLSLGAEGG